MMELHIFWMIVLVTVKSCLGAPEREGRNGGLHYPLPPPFLLGSQQKPIFPPILPNVEYQRHGPAQFHPQFPIYNQPQPYAQSFGYLNPRPYNFMYNYPSHQRDSLPLLPDLYNPLYIRYITEPKSPSSKLGICYRKVPREESLATLNKLLEPIVWTPLKENLMRKFLESCVDGEEDLRLSAKRPDGPVNLITLIFPKSTYEKPVTLEEVIFKETTYPESIENETTSTIEKLNVEEALEEVTTKSLSSQSASTESPEKKVTEDVTSESTENSKIDETHQKVDTETKLTDST